MNSALVARVNGDRPDGRARGAHSDLQSRRPYAYDCLTVIGSGAEFDHCDPGATGVPLEQWHPLLDLRLVRYLLAVPAVPWCMDKHLLRLAMRGVLSDAVRLRPKSPLAGIPALEALRRGDADWLRAFRPAAPRLRHYVNVRAVPDGRDPFDPKDVLPNRSSLSLACWLSNLDSSHHEGVTDDRRFPQDRAAV